MHKNENQKVTLNKRKNRRIFCTGGRGRGEIGNSMNPKLTEPKAKGKKK